MLPVAVWAVSARAARAVGAARRVAALECRARSAAAVPPVAAVSPRKSPPVSTPTRRSARSSADRLRRGATAPLLVRLPAAEVAEAAAAPVAVRPGPAGGRRRRFRRRWRRGRFRRGGGCRGTGCRGAPCRGRAFLRACARSAERLRFDRNHDRRFGVIVRMQRRDPPQRCHHRDMQPDRQSERGRGHAPGLRHATGQRPAGRGKDAVVGHGTACSTTRAERGPAGTAAPPCSRLSAARCTGSLQATGMYGWRRECRSAAADRGTPSGSSPSRRHRARPGRSTFP